MMDNDTNTPPLEPAARCRYPGGVARGTPVEMGGRTWHLPAFVPAHGDCWDRLYDHNVLRGRYEAQDVRLAAYRLLLAGYTLTADEAVGLLRTADLAELVRAVETALFGPEKPHRTYSDWARAALVANGLDPARVPPEALRDVLDQLVLTGRAAAPEHFISAAAAAEHRRRFLERAGLRSC